MSGLNTIFKMARIVVEKSTSKKESMSEDAENGGTELRNALARAIELEINVGLTIDEIRYAANAIRKEPTERAEKSVLSKFRRVIEAHDYVEKRQSKRKKEAEAEKREAEAVELLSRGIERSFPCFFHVDLASNSTKTKGSDNGNSIF